MPITILTNLIEIGFFINQRKKTEIKPIKATIGFRIPSIKIPKESEIHRPLEYILPFWKENSVKNEAG